LINGDYTASSLNFGYQGTSKPQRILIAQISDTAGLIKDGDTIMKRPVLKNICWGNWLFFIIVTFLFIVSLLSACGTKGGLVLPGKASNKAFNTNLQIINLKNTYT